LRQNILFQSLAAQIPKRAKTGSIAPLPPSRRPALKRNIIPDNLVKAASRPYRHSFDVDSSNVRERILARIAQINGPPDSDNAREIIAEAPVGAEQ
jgi:hypothetical protein